MPSNHIIIYVTGYLSFFGVLWLSKRFNGKRLFDEKGPVNRSVLLLLHLAGILLFGMVCFTFSGEPVLQIVVGPDTPSFMLLIVTGSLMIAAIILAIAAAARKPVRLTDGPFDRFFLINYFIMRILFLCIYEMWFRGYFLTDCINSMGTPLAIMLNIGLYCLLHIVNGKQEVNACIPIGLVFCCLCIWEGAAWPAIVLHVVMAITYEIYLVKKINKPSISFI